eukprot:TRINITY_DN2489_c0_g1_i3.p1 TRINITY_DN2489_c0_g1~~TRINITY_DN2489_c0_g1_i3.p1  ORF type:complete len:235 (-),score=47.57 TRINITY_DN2489_c0_g1_i3:378-1082(-)
MEATIPTRSSWRKKSDNNIIFVKWIGNQGRCRYSVEFEDLAQRMLEAKQMKTLDERIVNVASKDIYIAYRKEKNLDIVYFVFTPLDYNKGMLRKLLRLIDEKFKSALTEIHIEKEHLEQQGPGTLNSKSIIKNGVMEAIDKYGEGVPLTDQILAVIDKNKAMLASNIDSLQARNEALVEQVALTETLVDLASQFDEKSAAIKQAMYMKRLKMIILAVLTGALLLTLIAWKLGVF